MFQVATRPAPCSFDMQMQQPQSLPGLNLPRTLSRPAPSEANRENISSIDPALAQIPFEYIRRGLHARGAEMYASISRLPLPHSVSKSRIPSSVDLPIMTSSSPTHVLAVYTSVSPSRPPDDADKAFIIPTHGLVLAAHCAKLPRLPPSRLQVRANGTATIPVIRLSVPAAEAFVPLHSFLVSRRMDIFLCSLLPLPSSMVSSARASSSSHNPLENMSAHQLATYLATAPVGDKMSALMGVARTIIGVWQNASLLGVLDFEMWDGLDLAWEALLAAMNMVITSHR